MYFVVESGEPELKLLYSARSEYGLDDVSPATWSEFVDR